MPTRYDEFTLVVHRSIQCNIWSSTQDVEVGSGAQFTISFNYKGGLNPAATAFGVEWYANPTDRSGRTNELSGANAPSGVDFNPTTPIAGGLDRNGSLSGEAPTLRQGEGRRELFAELRIVQAALNA